ncbi:hypothetical protein [Vreelandella venusta]|uniref:hypothetical protein n=1 Tax=Vreelandella venusta TaxID=44935 RepID=UPI00200D7A77|nr:hypothetical protein [Halomonas venusta]UQI38794.1 hypothetical protein M3L73_11145 [Halomonas venusta]
MHMNAILIDGPMAGDKRSFECLQVPPEIHVTRDGLACDVCVIDRPPQRSLNSIFVYRATAEFGRYSFVREYRE